MSTRNYSNTATEAALTGSVTSADTALAVTSYSGFPAAPFTAAIDRGQPSEEVVLVTSVSGSNLTATRGYDGTTAKSHAAGAPLVHVSVAKDYTEANSHVNGTSGVHGVSSGLVGLTDAQTLSNKTLTAPVLAAATSTGMHAHASATFSGTVSVTGAATLGAVSATSASVAGDQTIGGSLSVTGTLTLTGALSGSSATLTGALGGTTAAFSGTVTGTTATFTGLVTAATAPTAGGHLVNKTYADGQLATAKTYADTGDTAAKAYADARTPKMVAGAGTINTDASSNFTLTHTLGAVPSAVFFTPRNVNANGGATYVVTGLSSTTITGRRYYNNAPDPSNALLAYWLVVG